MSDKQRWPLKEALIIAETLANVLELRCERILIAGSIRRRKPEVGDIELLYIPRFEDRAIDLLERSHERVSCVSQG